MSRHRIKSVFISTYLTLALLAALHATWNSFQAAGNWLGAAVSLWGVLAFFVYVFTADTARTSANLYGMIGVAAAGALLATMAPAPVPYSALPLWYAWGLGLGGALAYVFWYSRYGRGESRAIAVGSILPEFALEDADGNVVRSSDFLGAPTLFMFYRGNWCPLCSAQVKELAAEYRALDERGVKVVLVSPQPHDFTRRIAAKFEVPFRFLVDVECRAAKQLGIFAEGGTPLGLEVLGYDSDTVLPTVIITDPGGSIVFTDQTDNYRVRPEPETFFAAIDAAGISMR